MAVHSWTQPSAYVPGAIVHKYRYYFVITAITKVATEGLQSFQIEPWHNYGEIGFG
jgi:hypothetical protein